jgi:hypothetical protein
MSRNGVVEGSGALPRDGSDNVSLRDNPQNVAVGADDDDRPDVFLREKL